MLPGSAFSDMRNVGIADEIHKLLELLADHANTSSIQLLRLGQGATGAQIHRLLVLASLNVVS